MSIFHLEYAANLDGLDPAKKLVLMAICDDASKTNRIAYPGMGKLQKWSGRSQRRVVELIEELIRDGHLARRAFPHPGRRAEFIVFPTDAELSELDQKDARLNGARKRPPRPKQRKPKAVDNSPEKGAAGRALSSEPEIGNGRGENPNGRGHGRTPPVRTPLDLDSGPVPEVTTDAAVENSGEGTGPAKPSAKPNEVRHGHRGMSPTVGMPVVLDAVRSALPTHTGIGALSDESLQKVANEITGRAAGPVRDATAYVIFALKNPTDAVEWIKAAMDHDWKTATSSTGIGGF